ncbi:hypothetical protein CCMA1212_010219 [Trichoderma ghanense]|uniref:Uncharacterized protein n=1 Tax=Trichoderma ghanense TaxID=65468 RepID=A0ABY2GQU6_9HYPO
MGNHTRGQNAGACQAAPELHDAETPGWIALPSGTQTCLLSISSSAPHLEAASREAVAPGPDRRLIAAPPASQDSIRNKALANLELSSSSPFPQSEAGKGNLDILSAWQPKGQVLTALTPLRSRLAQQLAQPIGARIKGSRVRRGSRRSRTRYHHSRLVVCGEQAPKRDGAAGQWNPWLEFVRMSDRPEEGLGYSAGELSATDTTKANETPDRACGSSKLHEVGDRGSEET